jgi:hypothetical protein
VDPKAGLDHAKRRKFSTLQGLELRTLGHPPVASRNTDNAIPALYEKI